MKKIFFLIISIIFSLMILEALLQIFDIQPKVYKVATESEMVSENPALGYVPNPDYKYHNSLGLNNREIDNLKAKVIILGDSITYGCCRDQYQKTYVKILDENIGGFDIINAGINGYNTAQEVEFYDKYLKTIESELLILQMSHNDWNKVSFDNEYILNAMEDRSAEMSFWILNTDLSLKKLRKIHLVQFYLYFKALKRLDSLPKTGDRREIFNLPEFGQENCFGGKCDGDISENDAEVITNGFQTLNKSLNKDQKVLVVLFPNFTDVLDYDSHLYLQHQYIANLAKKNNFFFLDLLDCYQSLSEYEIELIHYDDDTMHPSVFGHRIAAQCIYKYIEDTQLINLN